MSRRPAEADLRRSLADGEVILEFVRCGRVVRASAMDPATLTEVVVQGPAWSDPETLRALVLRKLDYALAHCDPGRGDRSLRGRVTPPAPPAIPLGVVRASR